jgi:hypothetical protein
MTIWIDDGITKLNLFSVGIIWASIIMSIGIEIVIHSQYKKLSQFLDHLQC